MTASCDGLASVGDPLPPALWLQAHHGPVQDTLESNDFITEIKNKRSNELPAVLASSTSMISVSKAAGEV